MGFDADRTKRAGKFYLKTNTKNPFCGKFSSRKIKLPFFTFVVDYSVGHEKNSLAKRNQHVCYHKFHVGVKCLVKKDRGLFA